MSWAFSSQTIPHQCVRSDLGRHAVLITYTQETGPFDKELIALLPKSLKYVCHNGAGYDNVDVDALTQRGMSPGTAASSSLP